MTLQDVEKKLVDVESELTDVRAAQELVESERDSAAEQARTARRQLRSWRRKQQQKTTSIIPEEDNISATQDDSSEDEKVHDLGFNRRRMMDDDLTIEKLATIARMMSVFLHTTVLLMVGSVFLQVVSPDIGLECWGKRTFHLSNEMKWVHTLLFTPVLLGYIRGVVLRRWSWTSSRIRRQLYRNGTNFESAFASMLLLSCLSSVIFVFSTTTFLLNNDALSWYAPSPPPVERSEL